MGLVWVWVMTAAGRSLGERFGEEGVETQSTEQVVEICENMESMEERFEEERENLEVGVGHLERESGSRSRCVRRIIFGDVLAFKEADWREVVAFS